MSRINRLAYIQIFSTLLLILSFVHVCFSQKCIFDQILVKTSKELQEFIHNFNHCDTIECSSLTFHLSDSVRLPEMPNLKIFYGNIGLGHRDTKVISGLSALKEVHGQISIINNVKWKDSLQTILAFAKLKLTTSLLINNIHITDIDFFLESLSGFDSLEIIEDVFFIHRFAGPKLNGFRALKKIGRVFNLQMCPNLLTLEGLENLREIGSQWETSFHLNNNSSLQDISALSGAKIRANVYTLFGIVFNPKLEICHIPMVCDFIAQNKFESFNIHTNAPGCQSKDEVKTACLTSSDDSADLPAISIFPNPVTDVVRMVSPLPLRSVTLYDISGKKIYHDTTGSTEIDMSRWHAGWYFLTIQLTDGTFHKQKVVKLF